MYLDSQGLHVEIVWSVSLPSKAEITRHRGALVGSCVHCHFLVGCSDVAALILNILAW